jgi:hypothetical protein
MEDHDGVFCHYNECCYIQVGSFGRAKNLNYNKYRNNSAPHVAVSQVTDRY